MESNNESQDKKQTSESKSESRLEQLMRELGIRDITDQSIGKTSLIVTKKPSISSKQESGEDSLKKLQDYIKKHKTDDPVTLDDLM
jgi:hypothetical protein